MASVFEIPDGGSFSGGVGGASGALGGAGASGTQGDANASPRSAARDSPRCQCPMGAGAPRSPAAWLVILGAAAEALRRSRRKPRVLRRAPRKRPRGVAAACWVLLCMLGIAALSREVLAAQTDIAIASPSAPAAPRILGAPVFAARPGTPFLYTIAATGQAPLSFAVSSLPPGLTLASDTGTISGTTPAAGTYAVMVSVSNGSGNAQRAFSVVSGDTVALTPPMGWNSYDSFGGSVTEAEVMAAAQAQKAALQPYGWSYVVVDYLWFDDEQKIDANGRFLPSVSRFPSATGSLGFKPLADKIHALGLQFGIHIMRGIPRKSVSANSPIAGSAYTASQAGNTSDPCPWDSHMWGVHGDTAAGKAWYDSLFAQYAAWGIDFVKVDDMLKNQPPTSPLVYHQAEVEAIRSAIDKSSRTIVLSLSPGPMRTADAANLNGNANMWRMVNDFWDANGLSTLADVFSASGSWQGVAGLGVGHWPDADMLPLGYLGPRCPVHAAGASKLTHNEQVSVMSLWSMLPSPLLFGGNEPKLTSDSTGPATLALLTNDEIIAVNQDSDGKKGRRISQSGSQQVWSKALSGGRTVVGFFNRGDADVQMTTTLAELGLTGPLAARDLWQRSDLPAVTGGLSVNVPWRGAAMILLSPPTPVVPPGSGGGAGMGAGAASDGGSMNASSGGGGVAGALSAGGATASAGAGGVVGVGANAPASASGSAGVGGSGVGGSEHAAASGAPSTNSGVDSPSGCSCRLDVSSRQRSGLAAVLLFGVAVLARRKRR